VLTAQLEQANSRVADLKAEWKFTLQRVACAIEQIARRQ